MIICGWQASLILRFRSPDPTVTARLGESVVAGGVSYRVDSFETATEGVNVDAFWPYTYEVTLAELDLESAHVTETDSASA